MKKLILIGGLFLAIMTIGVLFIRGNLVNAEPNPIVQNAMPHCGRRINQTTYEFYYAHLSTTDQLLVDLEFVRLLDLYDYSTLSTEQKIETINLIKAELIDYMVTESMITGVRR